MLITILILIFLDVIKDGFIGLGLSIVPLLASAIFGSRLVDRLKYAKLTIKEFFEEWNPFGKGFSLKKLLIVYLCDAWFCMVGISYIIDQIMWFIHKFFRRRKRG